MNAALLIARKQKRLTQDELAARVGQLDQADISRIERLGWTPPEDVCQRLAEALDTPVEDLFGVMRERLPAGHA